MKHLWLACLVAAGCYARVQDHCAQCQVVSAARPLAPPSQAPALVLLVPGAFGFGDEWRPVLQSLRGRAGVAFVVYEWRGPWGGLARRADELGAVLQNLLDGAAPPLREVVVIAHSAGGLIAEAAARELRVPPRLRVRVASIVPPRYLWVPRYEIDSAVDTPLGISLGMSEPVLGAPPPGVEIVEYLNRDRDDAPPSAGVRRVLLGSATSHDLALGQVGVALVRGAATAAR